MAKIKILFVLPRYSRTIIGGHKVIYEYANQLVLRNYDVAILFINDWVLPEIKNFQFLKNCYANIMTAKEPSWFNLNKDIKKISAKNNKYNEKIKDSDVVIYTSCQTVGFVDKDCIKAKKIYFIQGYETFLMNKEDLIKTYNKPNYTNIVVSKSLKKFVDSNSKKESIYIPNQIDKNIFKETAPINNRNRHSVCFMNCINPEKGTKYTIETIKKLKEKYDDLEVYAFGSYKLNEIVPGLKQYAYKANPKKVAELLNKATVFINSSINEGFGLTGLEAMACGTVLVSSEYNSIHEYAQNNKNSLLAPIKDVESMYNKIVMVFEDNFQKNKLSTNGKKTAAKFCVDESVKKLEKIITKDY